MLSRAGGAVLVVGPSLLFGGCLLTSPLDQVNREEPASERTAAECQDQFDNDADGPIDCADPSCCDVLFCRDTPACLGGGEEQGDQCGNGTDDDGDGNADCDDLSCCQSDACGVWSECFVVEPGEETGEQCYNLIDDDGDTATDCADPSCCLEYACVLQNPYCSGTKPAETGELCYDTVDNDENGSTDCDDSSCCSELGCEGMGVCGVVEPPACPADLRAPGGADPLIDGFDDGDAWCNPVDGRTGMWRIVNDTQGVQVAGQDGTLDVVPEGGGIDGSLCVHTVGAGFYAFAGLELPLVDNGVGGMCPYSLDAYSGIHFAYRGVGTLRFNVRTSAVTPIAEGGTCDELVESCYDTHGLFLDLLPNWNGIDVRWNDLTQAGGSGQPFSNREILSLQFLILDAGTLADGFEIYLDEITLIP